MLNETEKAMLGKLLDDYAEKLGNAGCNDFDLPDTDEGRSLAKETHKREGEGDDSDEVPSLCVMDWILLGVLRDKLDI